MWLLSNSLHLVEVDEVDEEYRSAAALLMIEELVAGRTSWLDCEVRRKEEEKSEEGRKGFISLPNRASMSTLRSGESCGTNMDSTLLPP